MAKRMTSKEQSHLAGRYLQPITAKTYIKDRFNHPIWAMAHQREIEMIQRWIDAVRPKSFFDLACGPARMSKDLVGVTHGIAGDISPAMLNVASKFLSSKIWKTRQMDAFSLPFQNRSFDMMISFRFVRHFRFNDRRLLYNEILRVLRPKGVFIFDALNKRMERNAFLDRFTVAHHKDPKGFYDELWTRPRLADELSKAGFRILAMEPVINTVALQISITKQLKRNGFSEKSIISVLHAIDQRSSPTCFLWTIVAQKLR